MQTSEIFRRERERLALIGSDRDPALFQSMRAFVRNDSTMNRSIIVNWAEPGRNFGCRFTCDFCSWRDRAEAMGDIAPTAQALDRFLAGYLGYKVTISGGGDPLFNLERNLPRLQGLVDQLHAKGLLVEVVTKEIAVVRDLHDTALKSIDMWSFSAEAPSKLIADTVRKVGLARISKVCSPGTVGKLAAYTRFYREAGAYQILFREDFYATPPADDARTIAEVLRANRGLVRWLPNKTCSDNLFLIGDVPHHGDVPIEKVNISELENAHA